MNVRASNVPASLRALLAIVAIAAVVLGALAGLTVIGVRAIERAHPPSGRLVEVEGGRLHVVELGSADATPVVLLHGVGDNLGDMRLALGDRLAANYRVILMDRPGHGWSDRPGGSADASPVRQAKLAHQALTRIGVSRAILVAHSWSGALATAYALDYPLSVAGLVLLAPLTHQLPMSVGWYDSIIKAMLAHIERCATAPILGPLFVRTLALPLGKVLLGPSVQSVFAPQVPPRDYLERTGAELILRPSEFVANAEDLGQLRRFLEVEAPRYATIEAPTIVLTGDHDEVVLPELHAKAIAAALPHGKLVVLPGVGHMVQFAAPERVVEAIAEIDKIDARNKGRIQRAGR
jgi:pimeloyl-ACP methyl ester carboxylesterase